MNLVTVSEVHIRSIFGDLEIIEEVTYYQEDVQVLKNSQVGIADITQAEVNYYGDLQGYVRAIIGLDSSGRPMAKSVHGVILPCPPYCGGKGKNSNPPGIATITFTQAQTIVRG